MSKTITDERTYDLVVIGGGPAGVEAATLAGRNKLKTLLVSEMPAGGRATYGSLLPSKAWLHTAETLGGPAGGSAAGSAGSKLDLPRLRQEIQDLQKGRTQQLTDSLRDAGVEIVSATARLLARGRVRVRSEAGSTDIEAGSILIAAGSEPRFFPNVKPDGDRIIAPRHTQKLQHLPESMIMVGGGVTGSEYSSAFQKLGTKMHLITDIDRLLPRTDPELAALLQKRLEMLGVQFSFNSPIERVENLGTEVRTTTADGTEFRTDYAFVATGRRPDDSFLEEAQERPEQDAGGWVTVDAVGRTSLDGVYAAGDIAGAPLTANNAHTMACRVVRDILGLDQSESVPALIEAVYTEPQLVHIGPVHELSISPPEGVRLHRHSYDETLLGRIHGDTDAVLKLWVDDKTNAIRGAAAFGESAVDILAPLQLAMEHHISADAVRATPLAHPALSEVLSL